MAAHRSAAHGPEQVLKLLGNYNFSTPTSIGLSSLVSVEERIGYGCAPAACREAEAGTAAEEATGSTRFLPVGTRHGGLAALPEQGGEAAVGGRSHPMIIASSDPR